MSFVCVRSETFWNTPENCNPCSRSQSFRSSCSSWRCSCFRRSCSGSERLSSRPCSSDLRRRRSMPSSESCRSSKTCARPTCTTSSSAGRSRRETRSRATTDIAANFVVTSWRNRRSSLSTADRDCCWRPRLHCSCAKSRCRRRSTFCDRTSFGRSSKNISVGVSAPKRFLGLRWWPTRRVLRTTTLSLSDRCDRRGR